MPGKLTTIRKDVVRLILDVVHSTFDQVEVGVSSEGLKIRGIDAARTIVLDAALRPKAFSNYEAEDGRSITLENKPVRDFLAGIIGPFEGGKSSIELRLKHDQLEIDFRHADGIRREKAFRGTSDEQFVMPKFEGLSKASRCVLDDPSRLSMAAASFGEQATGFSVTIGDGKFGVSASSSDFLLIPAVNSGSGRTRLHRLIFSVTSSLSAAAPFLSSADVSVVNEGVARFNFDFGSDAQVTYYVAPLVDE